LSSRSTVPSQILFLPGALGNRNFWEPLAGELQLRVDKAFMAYPGFAGVPADPSITCFEDLVDLAVSRIDSPTALIAQSMGGVLAIETTLRRPDLVTHLVMVATSGGLNTASLGAIDWRQAFKHEQSNLPDWFTSYNSDLTAKLGGIDVPVLLIWGDQDPISPIAVGQELLHLLPNAEFHILPGGEHDVARTHAQTIAPIVEAHLQKRIFTSSRNRDSE